MTVVRGLLTDPILSLISAVGVQSRRALVCAGRILQVFFVRVRGGIAR